MRITIPGINPHGVNSGLFANVTEADPNTRYTAEIIRTNDNKVLGTKIFEGSESFSVGLQGVVTQNFSSQPVEGGQFVEMDTKRAFAIYVKIGNVTSDLLTVCCSQQDIAINTPLSARNGIAPMTHTDKVQLDLLTSLESTISAHITLFPEEGGEPERIDLCKRVTGDGVMMILANGPKIAERLAQSGKEFAKYNAAEVVVLDDNRSSEIVRHRLEIRKPEPNSVRMCWRNRLGGIDYYTFPFLKQKIANIDKSRAKTTEGGRIVSAEVERQLVVCSEFMDGPMFDQVSEIAESPQVWIIVPHGDFESVSITNSQVIWQPNREQRLELTVQYAKEESFII